MDFTVGDVVRLKSGGPDMTVTGFGIVMPPMMFGTESSKSEPYEDKNRVVCRWWDKKTEDYILQEFVAGSIYVVDK